jgi:hypothetical protein
VVKKEGGDGDESRRRGNDVVKMKDEGKKNRRKKSVDKTMVW